MKEQAYYDTLDYVTDNKNKWDVIRRLEERRAKLDDS